MDNRGLERAPERDIQNKKSVDAGDGSRDIRDIKPCKIDPRKPRVDGYVRTWKDYAHREAWIEANGPIPTGLCVLHKCDVRNCTEPSHLFLGTKAENNQDRSQKGRTSRHNSKLSMEQVREIRKLYPSMSQRKLASQYGVSQRAIGNLLRGQTYIREY